MENQNLKRYAQITFNLGGFKYKARYDEFILKEFHTPDKTINFGYKSYDETKILLSYLKVNKIEYKLKYQ
mgnify:FL=1